MAYRPTYINVLAAIFFVASAVFLSKQEPIQRIFKEISPATVPEAFNQDSPSITRAGGIEILIFGDMMLDRSVRGVIEDKGIDSLFSDVAPAIYDADLAVVNAEGSFTEYPSEKEALRQGSLKFTFATDTLPHLRAYGFDLFGLANNHTLNFGSDGLAQTRKFLTQNDITFFGDPSNKGGESAIVTFGSTSIAFVGYHAFAGGRQTILDEIRSLDPLHDFVFIFPHWGTEYQSKPEEEIRARAKEFIDAGADAVFGAHPHVVQTIEFYKNKAIFYSLGNFIFDQYFSKQTQEGLAVMAVIQDDGIHYNLKPMTSLRSKPTFLEGEERADWIERFFNHSLLLEEERISHFKNR